MLIGTISHVRVGERKGGARDAASCRAGHSELARRPTPTAPRSRYCCKHGEQSEPKTSLTPSVHYNHER